MKIKRIRKVLNKGLKFYLIYIFIFAFLLFAFQSPKEEDLGEFYLNKDDHIEIENNDRVALVEAGEDGAVVRINMIENAKENLDIAYYSIHEGKSTDILFGGILSAADRGVDVRIILDGLAYNLSGDLKNSIYGFHLHPNIELKFYNPFNPLLPRAWNNRLHDKIIMADGKLALIGGRNLGDKYFIEEIAEDDFSKDRDVLIFKDDSLDYNQSAVEDMGKYYDEIWDHEYSKASSEELDDESRDIGKRFNREYLARYVEFTEDYRDEIRKLDWHKKTIPTEGVRFVYNPIGMGNMHPRCLEELLYLGEEARESIFVQSPYIIPARRIKKSFEEYDIDLKKVTMLTNSLYSSPNPLAVSGYLSHRKNIVDSGVKLYEYQGEDSIHAKTYIFDDSISIIGSFNIDARSSYINTESMVIISSEEFADILKGRIQVDLDKSLEVDKDYSYLDDEDIEEGRVSGPKKILINMLSKISLLWDYLL